MTEPVPPEELACDGGLSPKRARKLLDRYRIASGSHFRLKDHDPGDTAGLSLDKKEARLLLDDGIGRLISLQEKLYSQSSWAVLCCFQAMDAAGKDGTIKHVMSGVNPQGVQVTSFKAPGPEDLSHDFLWRINRALPERGRIGIFNRSHYEEVLVVRVHPEMLDRQHLPRGRIGKHIWDDRLEAIAAHEKYLAQQGTVILKFFLHISREEQKRRFLRRLDEPAKNWKFEPADLAERQFWDAYMEVYEQAIRATAAPHAPWYVVPADHKWFARLVVVTALVNALDELDLDFPKLGEDAESSLALARASLEDEARHVNS
jgi:PPK2 family polyphosphate:nucleotide phosphotransferase